MTVHTHPVAVEGEPIRVKSGCLRIYFAFEVGEEIQLEAARAAVTVMETPTADDDALSGGRGLPFFGYDPPPISAQQIRQIEIKVGEKRVEPTVELRIWPFGVVSIMYRIKVDALTLEELVALRLALSEDKQIELDARARVNEVVNALGASVSSPVRNGTPIFEYYVVAQLDELEPKQQVELVVDRNSAVLARFLRQEVPSDEPSADVIEDILNGRCSWTTDDVSLIDWDGAIVIGPDNESVHRLLEVVQVQLVDLKFIEHRLERYYDQVYDHYVAMSTRPSLIQAKNWTDRWNALGRLLREFVRMLTLGVPFKDPLELLQNQMAMLRLDAAHAQQTVLNSVSFLGHATLHRIYTIATNRAQFSEVSQSIESNLRLLDGLATKTDSQAGRRLEIMVVILFYIEVFRGFFPH